MNPWQFLLWGQDGMLGYISHIMPPLGTSAMPNDVPGLASSWSHSYQLPFLVWPPAHSEGTWHSTAQDQLWLQGTAIYMCLLAACLMQARQMASGLGMHPCGFEMNGAGGLLV